MARSLEDSHGNGCYGNQLSWTGGRKLLFMFFVVSMTGWTNNVHITEIHYTDTNNIRRNGYKQLFILRPKEPQLILAIFLSM